MCSNICARASLARLAVLLLLLVGMSLGATIYVPRSVNEGATTTLQAQATVTSLSPLQYKWDLDADGNYGEIGPSANHGDETGRFVLFTTVGRDGSRIPAGSWPVSVKLFYTTNSSPGTLKEQGSNTVTIANVAPSLDSTGGPYTTTGASATLTARASDPGGKAPTVLWDLDLDGVFGETGPSAQNGNEVGATVTYTTAVTEATRTNTVRVKAFDGSLYSDIKSTTINVPGLLSTHRCPCASQPTGQCAIGMATGSASQISSSGRKGSPQLVALTSRVSGAQTGGWFRANPIVFDTRTMDGFNFCGSFQVLESSSVPSTHINNANDGGLSFVITTAAPTRSEALAGNSAGVVGRAQSTGVSIRYVSAGAAVVQPSNQLGFPDTNAPKSSLVSVFDTHIHFFAVQFQAGIQQLTVWIDGVKVLDQFFPLLDEGLLGPGPVFRLYPGMAASSSSSFRQDFAVSADFQFCAYTANSILPPTCALPCTATQTSNGCNVPAPSTSTCQGIGCSSNNVPIPSCSNNVCVGTCDPAYQDCNNDKAVDGCETRIADDVYNCGGCGVTCPQIGNGASCVNGVCQLQCAAGTADCNLDITDGCETNTSSSITSCGSCGYSCLSLGIAQPQCIGGVCQGACGSGFLNCDGNAANGCETAVSSDPSNCGGCNVVCSTLNVAAAVCVNGVCNPACKPGYAHCGGTMNTGCESVVLSSAQSCGSCGITCSSNNVTPLCSGGVCSGPCLNGFSDCNNNRAIDGCESNTLVDASNCGSCGSPCSTNHVTPSCNGGLCQGTCQAGWGNCDGDLRSNGCETDTTSDVQNCGSCGTVCSTNHVSQVCSAGVCSGLCAGLWLDCNNNKQLDGCEHDGRGDPSNCGACGNVCSAGKSCLAGSCVTILVNGGFENSTTLLAGWQDLQSPTPGCATSVSASGATSYVSPRTGMYQARTSCTTSTVGAGLQQTISLNPGQIYTVTGYFNGGFNSAATGALYINGTMIASKTTSNFDTNWHKVTAMFYAYTSLETFGFSMYSTPGVTMTMAMTPGDGYSFWDDFSIV